MIPRCPVCKKAINGPWGNTVPRHYDGARKWCVASGKDYRIVEAAHDIS